MQDQASQKAINEPDIQPEKIVVTFGTFDVFHIGHLNILERASRLGTQLVVGVSTDALNLCKKNRAPLYTQQDRFAIVSQLKCVSRVFYEHSLEKKREYLLQHGAHVLVMGDDWHGRFDEFKDICEVVYLPRTPDISTTQLIAMAAQQQQTQHQQNTS
jgi:glycerol-3-phosphate cytidylyltransferase